MVGNQRPCIAGGLRLLEDFSQSLQKMILVIIAAEYLSPFNAPGYDLVDRTSNIYTCSLASFTATTSGAGKSTYKPNSVPMGRQGR